MTTVRTGRGRFSVIGALNGHTERIMTSVTGAMQATLGILTIADVWTKEIGAAVQIAVAAWIVVFGELIRARLAHMVNLAKPPNDEPDPNVP